MEALLGTDGDGAVVSLPALLAGANVGQRAVASVWALPVLDHFLLPLVCRVPQILRAWSNEGGVDAPGVVDGLHRLLADGDGAVLALPTRRAQTLHEVCVV